MRERRISYRSIILLIALLIILCVASVLFAVFDLWFLLIISVPSTVLVALRLLNQYRSIVNRLDFIIRAVENDDYSFRFSDNPNRTENAFVNYSLNKIKNVMDEKKRIAREDDSNFELIMEYANIGIMLIMPNGIVIHSNSKALSYFSLDRVSHIEHLRPQSEELADILRDIKPAEQRSVCLVNETGELNLVISCANIVYKGKEIRVVTLGDIKKELNNQEAEVWEKFTHILTHEIMNSLAPITSISNTLINNLDDSKKIEEGLAIIHSTSDRLMQFVNSFRQFTRIPAPQKTPFYLKEIISDVVSLSNFGKIKLDVDIEPDDTMLYADRTQLTQVFVNLLKNAIESCEENEDEKDYRIEIKSHIDAEECIRIEISNNGGKIPDEIAENIFMPFFTTKRDGSGIGLAISRQILRLHGGTLRLIKNTEEKVSFLLIIE